jgi:integrating conjugative element relaxase (TIGR03760 family)
MFKGMFDLASKGKKKPIVEKGTVHVDPTPILSSEQLLQTEKRQQTLQDIRDLLSLPDDEYNRVFLSVIQNFAEFVQNIPETERSYFSSLGGMLDHALERASLSMFLCRTYLLPEDANLASLSEEEMLWVYAVFTAALLLDIGKLATRHVITLTDSKGNAERIWLPYAGPMVGQTTHYVYSFAEENYDHMRHLVTPLLARQILPPGDISTDENGGGQRTYGGFNWLASDPEVLESWLAMLADEHRQVGSILTVIPLADAQILESYFTDRKVFRRSLPPHVIALLSKLNKDRKEFIQALKDQKEKLLASDTDKSKEKLGKEKAAKQSLFGLPMSPHDQVQASMMSPLELSALAVRDVGQRFMHWVQQGIANKTLNVGQLGSALFTAENKVFVNQQLLQQFLAENKSLPLNNVNDLRAALQQAELTRPMTASEMSQIPALASAAGQLMVVQSPSLVMGFGLGQIANTANLQAQAAPPQTQPTVQTSQEAYEAQQQKLQQQRPETPRPIPPGGRGR